MLFQTLCAINAMRAYAQTDAQSAHHEQSREAQNVILCQRKTRAQSENRLREADAVRVQSTFAAAAANQRTVARYGVAR